MPDVFDEVASAPPDASDIFDLVEGPAPRTEAAVQETHAVSIGQRMKALAEGAGIPTSVEGLKETGKFLIRSPVQDVKDIYQDVTQMPERVRNLGQTLSTSPAAHVYQDPGSVESFRTYGTVIGMLFGPKAGEIAGKAFKRAVARPNEPAATMTQPEAGTSTTEPTAPPGAIPEEPLTQQAGGEITNAESVPKDESQYAEGVRQEAGPADSGGNVEQAPQGDRTDSGPGPEVVRAYHGSPHEFPSFDLERAGNEVNRGGTSFGLGVNLTKEVAHAKAYTEKNGIIYHVDIPEGETRSFLKWETPVPDEIASQLPEVDLDKPIPFGGGATVENTGRQWQLKTGDTAFRLSGREVERMFGDQNTGEQVYRKLVAAFDGNERAATNWLLERGVKGITNNVERGTTNYTVFDPSILKIAKTERVGGEPNVQQEGQSAQNEQATGEKGGQTNENLDEQGRPVPRDDGSAEQVPQQGELLTGGAKVPEGHVVLYQGVRAGNIEGKHGYSGWWTADPKEAEMYARRDGPGGKVRVASSEYFPQDTFVDPSNEDVILTPKDYVNKYHHVGTADQPTKLIAFREAAAKPVSSDLAAASLPQKKVAVPRQGDEVTGGAEIPPALPQGKKVTLKARTLDGNDLEVTMEAREAERMITRRKNNLETLLDCLSK